MFVGVTVLLLSWASCALSAQYQERYLDVPVDHFSFSRTNETFKLRFLVVEQFYVKGSPIFFYCGNEADITTFFDNTGFLLEIAPIFNALVVFAEHRYYGLSMPLGARSLSPSEGLRLLTTSQALADFVRLIDHLGGQYFGTMLTNDTFPVVAFGGSYGGMLAAWLRMKYPHVVLGAVASSAPLLQMNNLELCQAFYRSVTESFAANGNCSYPVKLSWAAIRNLSETVQGRRSVSQVFKLCKPLESSEDAGKLIDTLVDIYVNLAMLNYPYPTHFLAPLPANPVKSFCDKLRSFGVVETAVELLQAVSSALEIATNFSGNTQCNNIETTVEQPVDYAWDFQACFELVMPICSSALDMFEPTQWNYSKYAQDCSRKYQVTPYSSNGVLLEHGGRILKYASNIVFSNGLSDPWCSGGVLKNVSDSVVAVLIPQAAHHYDLRAAHPVDSHYVLEARKFHVGQIKKWLNIP
ncbi:lysosomal Pro-X carboxypeptidase-like [Dendroctonus ponderosae]